jgi:isopentenyl phosphate kinase
MTTNVHVVIKLGGAAITHKNECEQFNAEAAAVVAQQIALLHQQDVSVIIVHGAGGFGHFLAKAAGLSAGGDGTLSERRAAAAQTHASVTKLNGRIIDQLLKCGVPAVGLSPIGTWRTRGRSVIGSGAQAVGELLRAGLVPVIHGDVVVDESQGWCILSGDTLVTELCKVFRPQVAVFMVSSFID